MKYMAVHLPSPGEGSFECETREDAEECIKEHLCRDCKEEGLGSPCGCEWIIIPKDKYDNAKTFEDLMDGAGLKVLYRRLK